ncbi:hypothetical protein [Micromonospora inyonensis]|nr:hypothetical protein [Micromonospora inyonensis]
MPCAPDVRRTYAGPSSATVTNKEHLFQDLRFPPAASLRLTADVIVYPLR